MALERKSRSAALSETARDNDRATTRTFVAAAGESAKRLGRVANHLWAAFGPTNVAIHRVATAAELGDVQVAIDLGPQIDTTPMPMERRVRHALEVARAYSKRNRLDEAQSTLWMRSRWHRSRCDTTSSAAS
jgi:hypothetical protein